MYTSLDFFQVNRTHDFALVINETFYKNFQFVLGYLAKISVILVKFCVQSILCFETETERMYIKVINNTLGWIWIMSDLYGKKKVEIQRVNIY